MKAEAEHGSRPRKTKWMLAGLLVFTIGVILLVIEIIFVLGKWFDLLASLIFLSGIAIVLYGVLIGIRARKSAEAQLTDPNKLPAPETPGQVDGSGLPPAVFGVIERTRELPATKDFGESDAVKRDAESL